MIKVRHCVARLPCGPQMSRWAASRRHVSTVLLRQRVAIQGWRHRFEEVENDASQVLVKQTTALVTEESEAQPSSDLANQQPSASRALPTWPRRLQHSLIKTFLPANYPASVGSTFLGYCEWQFLHMVTQTATGVLSMQALLYAIGVGAGAIPLAATVNWVLKDGLGQLGGVFYGALYGTDFDDDPKRHRFYAIVALQASNLMELVTPLVPHLFLPLASLSNVAKNISFLTSSATRAQLNLTFARESNLGDITAKIASQSIAASVLGTALGIGISLLTGADPYAIAVGFTPLALCSIWANHHSSLLVNLPTLNLQRLERMILPVLQQVKDRPGPDVQVPTPEDVGPRESFVLPYRSLFSVPLMLEPKLSSCPEPVLTGLKTASLSENNDDFLGQYKLMADVGPKPAVYLWFYDTSSARDRLLGVLHACAARFLLQQPREGTFADRSRRLIADARNMIASGKSTHGPQNLLLARLENAGWNIDVCQIASRRPLIRTMP